MVCDLWSEHRYYRDTVDSSQEVASKIIRGLAFVQEEEQVHVPDGVSGTM